MFSHLSAPHFFPFWHLHMLWRFRYFPRRHYFWRRHRNICHFNSHWRLHETKRHILPADRAKKPENMILLIARQWRSCFNTDAAILIRSGKLKGVFLLAMGDRGR
jgi:hypothetical protein